MIHWWLEIFKFFIVFSLFFLARKAFGRNHKYSKFFGFSGILVFVAMFFLLSLLLKPKSKSVKLDQDRESQAIIVGVSADFPPFTYMENDNIVGLDIDLVTAICKRLGRDIVFKNMPFGTLLPTLQLGHIQVVAAGLTATQEREKHVLFTRPYLENNPLVIVSFLNNPVIKVDDLKNRAVIVNEGYTADLYLSKIEDIDLKRLKTPAEAFLALKSGRAAAFVTAQETVTPFFEQYGAIDFNVSVIPGTDENASFAISLKYPILKNDIQRVLDSMQQDGSLAAIKAKWKLS